MSIVRKICRNPAFTLVDLLVILSIIIILATIIIPMLTPRISPRPHHGARSAAFVQELTGAAQCYQKDTYYFPGIRYEKLLTGYRDKNGKQTGGLTGSQVLAACVFGLYYQNVNDANPNNDGLSKIPPGSYTASQYVSYTRAKVIDETFFDLNDQFSNPRPVLYWPAVPENTNDTDSAFRFDDNTALRYTPYNIANRKADWSKAIINVNMGKTPKGLPVAWNYDSFLLLGPGNDREYFTTDDVGNFGK